MDSRLIKPIRSSPKPLLLKDHLLDDMSSCSSNGFKSFPRRQCCTSVRFLHEFDRKTKHKFTYVDFRKPPPPKSSLSALQSVISAVKRLPFGASKSPEKKKSGINSFLPRSFSKKIFKRGGFWKRKPEHEEIERWKSFDQLLKEDPVPSVRSCSSITTTTDGSKSYSWSGSEFTATSEGGNSASEANLNSPEKKNDVVEMPGEGDNGVGATNDDVSAESTTSTNSSNETKKQWSSDQEKEQFSPVSVLDCPFDDDDEVSSPFQHRLARMEGTRKKLLKKIQRFEGLAKLEPVNLTRRFVSHLDSDNESSDSPLPHSEEEEDDHDEDEDEEDEEKRTLELLDQMKASMTSHGFDFKADKLMLDFFREGIASEKQRGGSPLYDELVQIAEDWIGGRKPRAVFMEWEVEKNRQAYVEDMEKRGEWKRLGQENEEVVLELGNEVFAALLNELLLDITSSNENI